MDTWDDNGVPITTDVPYRPYLYIESIKGEAVSLYGSKVSKVDHFETLWDRNNYIKGKYPNNSETARLYECFPAQQQCLIDLFWQENEKPEFTQYPLRIHYLDIEVYCTEGFPHAAEAAHPINVATIYDSETKKFMVWGLEKDYTTDREDVVYYKCKDEEELLEKLFYYFEMNSPDILTGWNTEFFDIPYIMNRCIKLHGLEVAARISPLYCSGALRPEQAVREIIKLVNKRPHLRWYIEGISCIDYLDIYKRFCLKMRENYKLNTIAQIEVGAEKVEHEGVDLAGLADSDWQKFVDYNIQDVNLLQLMEEKLQYIALLRMLAYCGLTTFEAALGTVPIVNGAAAIRARYMGKKIPMFKRGVVHDKDKNPGAYVGVPQHGFQRSVISFDANSLYPSVMITCNMSPETKIGTIGDVIYDGVNMNHSFKKYTDAPDEVHIKFVNGKSKTMSKTDFMQFIKDQKIAITKAGVLFHQQTKGIMPEIVDRYYDRRVLIKKDLHSNKEKLSKLKSDDPEYKKIKDEIDRLEAAQMCIKVFINSVYGYFGNKHAQMGDDHIAASITLTGQAVIKQSNVIVREYVKEKCGNKIKDWGYEKDPVIYNDTDSVYITLDHLIDHCGLELKDDNGEPTQMTYDECQKIEDRINSNITKWARKGLNTLDPRFVFKREVICDEGMFLQKKRYVVHMLDDEGVKKQKYKYVGVEVVRNETPKQVKPLIKNIVESMLYNRDKQISDKVLRSSYDEYMKFPIEDVSTLKGCKEYLAWEDQCKAFAKVTYGKQYDIEQLMKCIVKKMPIHIKSAFYFNQMLDLTGLDSKYEKITDGDKVKFFYCKRNQYGFQTMGFKYEWPEELSEWFEPDYAKMFEKQAYSAIQRYYYSVGWRPRLPNKAAKVDLWDLLT